MTTTKNYLELIQGYYKFLCLGKYFESLTKSWTLHVQKELRIPTGTATSFGINTQIIAPLLQEIHKKSDQKNVYGYLLEISVFKGVFSAMREMIEHHASSRNILQDLLKDQYIPFEQIIRFLRNVLTHTSTSRIAIQEEDFQKQKEFLLSKHIKNLHLNFIYSSYIPQRKGNKDYACQIQLEISAIQPHVSLFDLISLHQMYLLTELCYNVSLLMTQRIKKVPSSKKQKSPLPPTTKKCK